MIVVSFFVFLRSSYSNGLFYMIPTPSAEGNSNDAFLLGHSLGIKGRKSMTFCPLPLNFPTLFMLLH